MASFEKILNSSVNLNFHIHFGNAEYLKLFISLMVLDTRKYVSISFE